jgi:nitrogen fixation protein FixH
MNAEKPMTGYHVAAIFVTAFAVIIGVNLLLAVNAVRSFPGLEVRNSYVASQQFDKDRAAQIALGWTVTAKAGAGAIVMSIAGPDGAPAKVETLTAVLGRATHVQDDQTLDFVFDGQVYRAPAQLSPGNWNIRMGATAQDGTDFKQRIVLHVGAAEK